MHSRLFGTKLFTVQFFEVRFRQKQAVKMDKIQNEYIVTVT